MKMHKFLPTSVLSVLAVLSILIATTQSVKVHAYSFVFASPKLYSISPIRYTVSQSTYTVSTVHTTTTTTLVTPSPIKNISVTPTTGIQKTVIIATPIPTTIPTRLSTQPSSVTQQQVVSATPTPMPTKTQSSVSINSIQTYIMNGINEYRASKGLSAVSTDPYTCNFAATRAQEITTSFTHDGFTNRINSHTLPYPSYSEVTENIAMTSDYIQVVPMWIASPGHAANMQKDTPYVCVAQSGNYFAYEGWKP